MSRVAILLCTLNGARFLPAQLASYINQKFENWSVFASDDGSTDDTKAILSAFEQSYGIHKLTVRNGPGRGVVANFLSLASDDRIAADFYACSDQDDVWETDKLSRAIDWLSRVPQDVPAVYCSRTRLIDDAGREIGFSPLFRRKPSFPNALVQSIAGGNTMVFNQKARDLFIYCGTNLDVPMHDWWLYMTTMAAGGVVYYDYYPSVMYRVHPDNVIGSNRGWISRKKRLRMLIRGRFRDWIDLNVKALDRFRPNMTADNERLFDLYCNARQQGLAKRLTGFARSGIYRQTVVGNLGLLAGALLKKI